MKTKAIVAIVVIILVIILVSCLCFMGVFSNKSGSQGGSNKGSNKGNSQGQEVVVDETNISDIYENPEKYSDNMYEVPTDNVKTTNSDIRVDKFTISEINDNMTLVYIDIVNQMAEPLSKDARLDINFLDENGNSLGIIGGVIEEDEDIRTGVGTTIRTQFLDRIPGIKGVEVTVVDSKSSTSSAQPEKSEVSESSEQLEKPEVPESVENAE